MSNLPYRPSDAEVVAGWAAEAMRDGRYVLGQALAKIAIQAESHEERLRKAGAVPVPFWGTTRDEEPRHPATGNHLSVINGSGPTGDGDADLAVLEQVARASMADPGATAVMQRPATLEDVAQVQVPTPPASKRCGAELVRDGVLDECRAVAYWSADLQRWVHVDRTIDAHHEPRV